MTAISNVFCSEFIACGSDSFLTKIVNGVPEHVETQRRKIFALDGLPGAISYWGFAGLERLNTADELQALAKSARSDGTLQAFAERVRDHFNVLFAKYPAIRKSDRGIGMHVVGYEFVEGLRIPELFLVTNFIDLNYTVGDMLGCSRRSNFTITGDGGNDDYLTKHAGSAYRKPVFEYLGSGNIIYFNNGDPLLFTIVANAMMESIVALRRRGGLRPGSDPWHDLATLPIDIIANLQRSFAADRYRLVGGRIHDLAIFPDGQMYSDSGVVTKRWSDR